MLLELRRPLTDEGLDLRAARVVAKDRDHDHLHGRDLGRDDEARVVAVRHHHRADQAGADAPRRGVAQLALVVLVRERDVVGAREVLAEVVRSAHLQCETVAHQPLQRQRVHRAGEGLGRRLLSHQHRHREPVLGDGAVVAQDQVGLVHRLLGGRVERVPLLPPELAAAQKEARAHLPAHHAGPLVRQLGQVPVALDVAPDDVADDRLRGRPDRERFLELLHGGAGLRHPRDLRAEALDVLGLLDQELARDEQGKCPVLVPTLLDHVVEGALDRLPHRPAVRADDHHAADARPVRELRLADDIGVPTVEVVGHLGDVLHEILLLLHGLFHSCGSQVSR